MHISHDDLLTVLITVPGAFVICTLLFRMLRGKWFDRTGFVLTVFGNIIGGIIGLLINR